MALAELIDNAIEYTRHNEGPRNISITCNKDTKTLVLEDNGCGMDKNALKSWGVIAETQSNIKKDTIPEYASPEAEKKYLSSFFSLCMIFLE